MRTILALMLVLPLAGSALAEPCRDHRHGYGYRHERGYGSGFYRYHHFHRYHAARLYSRPWAYGYYPACHGYGLGYGYGYGHGWYGSYGFRYFRPVLSFSHAYTRAFTVLTVDDDLLSGSPPARDGLPQPRTAPVGARFLVDSD